MKKDSKERLDKIYEKYDMYFTTYFRRNSYDESVGHMSRFLNLLVGLTIKSNGSAYGKYVKRYAEVFKLAEERDKEELDKLKNNQVTKPKVENTKPKAKTTTTANKTKTNVDVKEDKDIKLDKSYVDKYKETFVNNIGAFFKEGAIPYNGGVNTGQVTRLNTLFSELTSQLTELQDKRDIYEKYLGEVDQQMKVNYSGAEEYFEEWAELEVDLNLFEIKDELNDILLEMDDLDADDVDSIMEGMEADIFRLLEDIGDDEDSYEDFKEVEFETKPTENEEEDNEPVTKLIAEDNTEVEGEGLDFYGLEEVNKDVSLDINLDINTDSKYEDNEDEDEDEDIDLDSVEEDEDEEETDLDFYEVKQKPKAEPKVDSKSEDVKEVVEAKKEQTTKEESKQEPKLEIEVGEEVEDSKVSNSLEGLDFNVSASEDEEEDNEDTSEGFDTSKWEMIEEIEEDAGEESEDDGLTILEKPEENTEEDDGDDGLNNLDGILGSYEEEVPVKKKEKVVIKEEDVSKVLDQFM